MKKKKNRLFKFLFYVFFLVFLVVYFSEITGYYEYQNYKKKALTEEQIKKFESDVKNGSNIDINDYLIIENYNYNNKLSKAASKFSDGISKVVKGAVERVFKFISKVVDE